MTGSSPTPEPKRPAQGPPKPAAGPKGASAARPKPPGAPPAKVPTKVPAKPDAARPGAAKPRGAPAGAAAAPVDPGETAATAGPPKGPARPATPPGQPAVDPLVGVTLGRCRIEARIGQGKTATVYRAHHTALEATVAVKVLLPQARAVPEIVEKFASEARAIARIDNENVLKIYDVGQDGEQHYLVMELLDGDSILDVVQRETRFEPLDALRVVRQAANGLAAAHATGIIHRDVKPQNLVLLQDGTVKLVDFGLAAGDETGSQRVGTPHYMAPEVCESGQAVPKSDVYSLGISLYHMLTGQPPYAGKNLKEILAAHVKGEPLHPERKVLSLSREISELVRRLTRRDPTQRPTAAEVVAELDRIGGQDLRKKDALRARSARFRNRLQTQKSAAPLPLIVGGVVVVGVVIALLAMSGGGRGPDGPPAPAPAPKPAAVPGAPPPESAADRERREKREEEARLKKREFDAGTALKGIEGWIRENWHGPSDTEPVLMRYRNFRAEWKGTEAAKTVEQRLDGIAAGKVHPHPDRSWTQADLVEGTRAQWAEALPKVEELLRKGDFAAARALVPAAVEDAGGQLAIELRFWAEVTQHMEEFQQALTSTADSLGADQRTLTLPTGKAQLKKVVGAAGFEVQVDRRTSTVPWADVPPAELARVAHAAFEGKSPRYHLLSMAFAWVHALSEEFWTADLDLGTGDGAQTYAREIAAYKRTWEARSAKK